MTTQEVANRFHELAQQGQFDQIQNELFAPAAISIEPEHAAEMQMPVRVEGLEAIQQKGRDFNQAVEEMHGGYCNEPQVAGNHFSCSMGMDCTMKGGQRNKMDEIAVYQVDNGKIVKEQFFY